MIALIILSIAIAGTFGTVIPFHMSSIPEEYKGLKSTNFFISSF